VICDYFFPSTGFDDKGAGFFKDVTAFALQILSKGQEVLPRVELSLVLIHDLASLRLPAFVLAHRSARINDAVDVKAIKNRV
jgi:hypothetical protein